MNPQKARHYLWRKGILTWKLREYQLPIYELLRQLPKEIREAVVLISRRWGKSVLGVVMALEDCLKNPNEQVFIVGPNIIQTTKIITPIMNKICLDAPPGLIRPTKSEKLWGVGNSKLMIAAFDTAIESVRGMDAFNMYLEESGSSNPEDYEYTMTSVLNPTLMRSRGRKTHLTTPGKQVDHPLHTKTLAEAALNNALFVKTILDNKSLTEKEVQDEIKNMGGLESIHCKRELFCRIEKDPESTVCPEFDATRHVKEMTPPAFAHWLSVLDFGGTLDPHAHLLCYQDFERAKFCIYDERWHPINTDTGAIISSGLEMEKQAKWLDGPRRISDCPGQVLVDMRKADFRTIDPDKEKGSFEAGINAVRLAFQADQIEIHPRCKNLIAQCEHGRFSDNRKDFRRTPALGHLDSFAALMYGFKHRDLRNPFPRLLGKNRFDHHITPEDLETKSALEQAFFPTRGR